MGTQDMICMTIIEKRKGGGSSLKLLYNVVYSKNLIKKLMCPFVTGSEQRGDGRGTRQKHYLEGDIARELPGPGARLFWA